MTNAELIAKIKAEIERRKSLLTQHSKLTYDLILETFIKEYDDLLSFLSTLESEKPMDLEEEVKRYYSDNFDYISSDQPTLSILTNIARHFTDWQKERLFMDGLDAVRSNSPNKIEKTIAGVFVKYGMDNMKEQMMKEAIHYVVQDDLDSHGASYNIPFIRLGTVALKPKGIGVGDKVCIIIVKEGEK